MKELSRHVIVNLPDGGELKLQKLSPSDFIALAETIQAQRKKLLRENLDAVDAPLDDKLRALADLDARQPRWGDVLNFALTPAGGVEVMRIALKSAGVSETSLNGFDPGRFQDHVLDLLHVERSVSPQQGEDASREASKPETGDSKRQE